MAKSQTQIKGKDIEKLDGREAVYHCNRLIKPDNYEIISDNGNITKVVINPLERGMGHTIGHALRRVLLSSISGAAVVSISIDNIDHEFSHIPGIQEDIIEIIMNIKSIAIKCHTSHQDSHKMTLHINGKKNVTAGMIKAPANLEIMNKDLIICHANTDTEIKIDMVVKVGKGYVSSEDNRTSDMPIGIIPIDSIFSPIVRVVYDVENSRVGSDTEYDKLSLTIESNGAVSGEGALSIAAKILQDQLRVLKSEDAVSEEEEKSESSTLPFDIVLLRRADDLELSVRSQNCLRGDNILYVGDLVTKTESAMMKTPNFGRKSLNEIRTVLSELNLSFGMDVPSWPPEDIEGLIKKHLL